MPRIKLLFHGDSDPFNANATSVNLHINRMIDFARSSYYPSLSVALWLRKQPRNAEDGLRFFELGLKTPGSTVAHVTSYGAALIRLLPTTDKQRLRNAWLEVRAQALQTLRQALTIRDHPSTFAIPLLQPCLYLFQGEVENRTFESAIFHAKTLHYLFPSQLPSPSNIFLYLPTMHSTLEAALFPLQRPIMTFDNWQPDNVEVNLDMCRESLVFHAAICSIKSTSGYYVATSP